MLPTATAGELSGHIRRRPPPSSSPESRHAPNPSPSRCLHNFSFPSLSWGSHRLLRCSKSLAFESDSVPRSKPLDADRRLSLPLPPTPSPSPSPSPEKSVRRSPSPVIGGVRVRVSKAKEDAEPEESSSGKTAEVVASRPWNLRARRAACNAPSLEKGKTGRVGSDPGTVALPPMRSDLAGKLATEEPARFSLTLTRKEIEEDFSAFKGTKPPRRPKKRPKIVQRQIEALLPGFWLSEITPDSYKIDE